MQADAVLVIDAGTSALRALLVDRGGAVTPVASEAWRMFVPADAAPFGRELNASDVEAALASLWEAALPHRERMAAIAFTGQREGIAFLDEHGDAVFVSPNIDARGSAEGIAIDVARGDDVYSATGHLPSLMQAPAKLQWLRANRPAAAARVTHVLPLVDWLAFTLTGSLSTSRSLAAENGLLDIESGTLPASLLSAAAFDCALVPPLVADGARAGVAARGVLAGAPVVLDGADTQCALLGMGARDAGDCGAPAGWSAPIQLVTPRPVFDAQQRTWTGVHVVPRRWILESNALETGRAWEWICSMIGIGQEEAEQLAAAAPIGSGDAMAVLGPRVMRASRLNAGVGGLTLPLPLIMSAPGRRDLLRSVLESIAFTLRANLEQLEEVSGMHVAGLRLGGGMSRSATFARIVADVIDRPVEVAASHETSALGAAILASVTVGLHDSLDSAAAAMAGHRARIEPDMPASAQYEDGYARWCGLADAFERLAAEG